MKILIFSDSHGATKLMAQIVAKLAEHINCVMFLGDELRDINRVASDFPSLAFYMVPGNCDFSSSLPKELIAEAGGKRFFLTHGDRFGIKSGYERIEAAAAAAKADVCLFGHTHVPIVYEKNGIVFLNPGSITEPRGARGKTYAVIEILNNTNTILPKIIDA